MHEFTWDYENEKIIIIKVPKWLSYEPNLPKLSRSKLMHSKLILRKSSQSKVNCRKCKGFKPKWLFYQ